MELISVIIPIYKVEEYLDHCIKSIVEQTYRKLEIILVDDGSPDKCPLKCDEWAERDGRIRVIHKKNGGLSDARNVGMSIAKGSYISFIDSDDWISPDFYEKLYRSITDSNAQIAANIGAALCSCISYLLGQGLIMNGYYYKVVGIDIPLFWKNILKLSIIPGCMLVLGLIISNFFVITNWGTFFVGVLMFSCIYAVLMYGLSLNDYEKNIFRKPLLKVVKMVVQKDR